jgi:hypothetical protein
VISFLQNFQETRMASFDEIEKQAEGKVVAFMDRDAMAARMAAWAACAIQVAYGLALFAGGALIGSVICEATALILFWLLIKSRAA